MNHSQDTSHQWRPDDDDILPSSADTPVVISAGDARATIATLNLFHQFFRHHASETVHTELRAFCALQGWHPLCGTEALLDDLGWHTLALRRALDTTTEHH